jgi:uncharacterized membrane protein
MKRYLLVSLVVFLMTPGVAPGQTMGRPGSDAPPRPPAQHEMKPQVPAPGMMVPGPAMMGGGMMGSEPMSSMMPSMMSSMMDGMMPGKTRGCMMMAEGMMKGQIDVAQMRKALALSDEQVERLRASQRPFQKETILTLASMKVAELELADLLAADKADFGKVEAKLKEIEGMRTKVRLAHIKATVAVKGLLSVEQLEHLQGMSESAPPPPVPAAPQQGATPPADPEHEQHH